MKTEIKTQLENGKNFSNENANWFTINRINKDGKMAICVNEEYKFFNTLEKYTNAIINLINTGSL